MVSVIEVIVPGKSVEVLEIASSSSVIETEIESRVSVIEVIEKGVQGPPGIQGEKGPKGDPGDVSITSPEAQYTFSWGDATPAALLTVEAGKAVFAVEIVIENAFDGVSPSLSVGDDGDHERLMPVAGNDPGTAMTYVATRPYVYSVETVLKLWITPGDFCSTGNGYIRIHKEM